MAEREVFIVADDAELGRKSAERFIELARRSVKAAGRFSIALSGGSTPRHLYSLLASPGYTERLSWPAVRLFWGDERCVPPDHADSNFCMAHEALLSKIDIPRENIYRMAGELEPKAAAAAYELQLKNSFGRENGEMPRFDLILLGIGDDGHTASLFPGSDVLAETGRLVAAPYVEKLKTHRLTLTLPVLNHANEVCFLVSGSAKAAVLREILSGSADLPAAKVQPVSGRATWFITEDAAAEL